MAKKKTATKKQPKAKNQASSSTDVHGGSNRRRLRPARYASFRLQRRIPKTDLHLSSALRLGIRAVWFPVRHWKVLGGILFVYLIVSVITLKGVGLTTGSGRLASLVSLLSNGSGQSGSASNGGYQLVAGLLISLAFIWALREAYAGTRVRLRDSFYRGMTPLIPFVLVLLVIALELLPAIIGVAVYITVLNNGIAVLFAEKMLWGLMMTLLILLSCYLVTSTVFALYIVSLPGMEPFRALRSARQLVRYRRWVVMRKLLFLPLASALFVSIILLPFIFALPKAVPAVLLVLQVALLGLVHSYIYALYRELLNE